MAGLTLTVVSPEREVLREEDVTLVLAPSVEGQLGILPRHAPLITQLEPGTLELRRGAETQHFSITGGFLEVMDNTVTVLADASENASEISRERAEAAREAAVRDLEEARRTHDDMMTTQARLALLRALARLRTVERSRRG
ncbi:MAG: ATP synthase F1 subunit epsilon [Chloroflexota bacterium]|nr:ATP synthase F1 subunit epsilon [Chloroflexota bacterium]